MLWHWFGMTLQMEGRNSYVAPLLLLLIAMLIITVQQNTTVPHIALAGPEALEPTRMFYSYQTVKKAVKSEVAAKR